jgi:hypothetical protein
MDIEPGDLAGPEVRFIQFGRDLDPVGHELFDPEGLGRQQDVVGRIYLEGITACNGRLGNVDVPIRRPLAVEGLPEGLHLLAVGQEKLQLDGKFTG